MGLFSHVLLCLKASISCWLSWTVSDRTIRLSWHKTSFLIFENSVVFLIQPSIPQLFAMEVTNKHLTVCNEQQTLREKCPNTKSVYFWSVFSFIRTEYGDLFPYKGSCFSAKIRISTLRNTFHIWLGVFRIFLEHVYMRTEENSNRFDISLQDKVSRRCKVTSLSTFTRLRAAWNSPRCKFHFSQIDQSEISNRSEFSM